MTLRVAIVGCGYWGPKVARVLASAGVEIRAACDTDVQRARAVCRACTTDVEAVLSDPGVDAVVFATPPTPERDDAVAGALQAGKHVWIEKPFATSALAAMLLAREARAANRVLFVDHTFCYHPAVRKAREIVQSGALGDLRLFDSTRVNLGLVQDGVPVWWDLAPHDVSIFEYVTGQQVEAVQAVAACHPPATQPSTAYVTLVAGGLLGHLSLSWNSPVKMRRTVFGGADKTLVYDDLDREEPIKVYDRAAVEGEDNRVAYREGDIWIPRVAQTEALVGAAREFIECCATDRIPLTDGAAGECPACQQMYGEWLPPARSKRSAYHRLCDALCRAGCTDGPVRATPENVLRELERARLA